MSTKMTPVMAEMTETNLYEAIDRYSRDGKIGYVHLRNVKGKVPHYVEVFVDEGDVDIFRIVRILHRNGYDGVITPDHTPGMTSPAPWHAGMAYQMGYLKAVITQVERES